MKKILILLVIFYLFSALPGACIAVSTAQKNPDNSAKISGFHDWLVNFVKTEEEAQKPEQKLSLQETIFLTAADLVFSVFCLWLAMLIYTGEKSVNFKMYCWFLFILNFSWFVILLLFKVVWRSLDYLVLKLQPDMYTPVEQNFSLFVLGAAIAVYIWLLARTFNLKFYGAVGTFFVSHLVYFSVLYLCVTFIPLQDNSILKLLSDNLGAKPAIAGYISDIHKITSHDNVASMLRLRVYHL
ncbi:MAG: hypothetical protein PHN57_04980 [Candidatus Omnitrophica bacterium]|nr:hypothetical protein [Candidatus Omnitrophota bacterium]